MRNFLSRALILSLVFLPVSARAGVETFKKAIDLYGKGKYPQAAELLRASLEEVPEAGDYILFYTAKSHIKSGKPESALSAIKILLNEYPDSPLRKAARQMELEETLKKDEAGSLELVESYINDYPKDDEKRYLFASLLKNAGKGEKARAIFKDIYINASSFSMKAFKELQPSEITSADLLKRGLNLTDALRFGEAEECLKDALLKDNGILNEEIMKALGLSLFKQKKYKEASEAYLKAGDLYDGARSLYRAGNEEAFAKILRELMSMQDKRASSLFIASAHEKRRRGATEEALKMFASVMEKYPSRSADALWGVGWTHYMARNYEKALSVFTELYKTHEEPQYLYWMAVASEKTGKDASALFTKLMEREDFYAALSCMRTKCITQEKGKSTPRMPKEDIEGHPILKRPAILIAAGLKEDASNELSYRARSVTDANALTAIAYNLEQLGRYKEAMAVTLRLPPEMRPSEILYPAAYWPLVKKTSEENSLDPYLILSVIREESRFDPEAYSWAGAMGLMQIMPETAGRLSKKLKISIKGPENIYDIDLNLRLGSFYLGRLMEEFGGSLFAALAAYNAGEHNVRKWLDAGRYESYDEFIEDIPYQETKKYIKRILLTYRTYKNKMQ
jgi:soluble lytic murein transglycosylase